MDFISTKIQNLIQFLKENEDWLSLSIGVLSLVLLVTIGGYLVWQKISLKDNAQNQPNTNTFKLDEQTTNQDQQNRYHIVKRGEYLWEIAQQYYQDGYKWVEIAKANHLTNPDLIYKGQKLVIPSLSPTPSPTNPPSQVSQEKTNQNQDIVYKVKKGDMLWWLTYKFYKNPYLYTKVAKYNQIKNPSLIEVGQVIKFPPKSVLDKI